MNCTYVHILVVKSNVIKIKIFFITIISNINCLSYAYKNEIIKT